MNSPIVIAHPLTTAEALALIAEPATAFVFDLDDCTVGEGRVVAEERSVVCWMIPDAAARIAGHRVNLELEPGPGDGADWTISILGFAEVDAPGAALGERGPSGAGVVPVRVRPDLVRATRFDTVLAAVAAPSDPEATA